MYSPMFRGVLTAHPLVQIGAMQARSRLLGDDRKEAEARMAEDDSKPKLLLSLQGAPKSLEEIIGPP